VSNASFESLSTDPSGVLRMSCPPRQPRPVPLALSDPRLITTWTALRARGVSPDRIRAQLRAGRWRRWGYAIALHNGPLTREQQWFVARAHGGPQALLTGFTAAEAFGLRGWQREQVDVLVPLGARCVVGSPVPLRLHRVRDWDSVQRHGQAPVHRAADALLRASATFPSPRPACGLLAAAVQQRIVSAAELSDGLDRACRIRHRSLLRAAVADIGQGAQALSEIDFVRLCRRYRLPPPDQQTVRRERGGRRRYLDATWRRKDGRLVVVEVDGALHLDQRRWWDDQHRQNEIVLSDAIVLRFPSIVIRTQPELVAAQLRRALAL
jgi:hypothetical protein